MSKKGSVSPKSPASVPKTVRELRTRLETLGNPWSVHISLNDDDQLPQPSRGGIIEEQKDTFESVSQLRKVLLEVPPTNPFLQQDWIDAGWIKDKEGHGIVASTNDPSMPTDGDSDQPNVMKKSERGNEQ